MRVWLVGMIALLSVLLTGCAGGDAYFTFSHPIEQTGEVTHVNTQDAEKVLKFDDVQELLEEQTVLFEEDVHSTFAYDSLSDTEKLWYRDINDTLGNLLEKQELTPKGLEMGLQEADIDRIFQCVLNDHPEYFYVEGYTYIRFTRAEKTVKIEFSGTYSMNREEALQRKQQIDAASQEILANIPQEASDYEKIKYVYETLVYQTEYDLSAPDNQNIYSVLVNHRSVCQGYAKTLQYLLNRLGVECTLVAGTVDTGEGHAWNLVKSSGNYYYVDATWGDAFYLVEEAGGSADNLPQINYDYLCITTEQLLRTHTLGGVVPMPVCDSLEDNYYVREGVYFTEINEQQLETVFQNAANQGQTEIALKCADRSVYEEMVRNLITDQKIFSYMSGDGGSVAYAQNEKQLSMTFWLAN